MEAKREEEQREEQGEMTCEEITAKRREQRHERGCSCVKGYGKGINTIKGKERRQSNKTTSDTRDTALRLTDGGQIES